MNITYKGFEADKDRINFLFWRHVKKLPNDGCWEWQQSCFKEGYGQTYVFGRNMSTHRTSWIIANGDPGKLFVCHKCDNRKCVRPDHLFLGTNQENMDDRRNKGYDKVVTGAGEQHFHAVLTDALVVELRQRILAGESTLSIAKEWNMHPANIGKAATGKAWAHVPGAIPAEFLETKGERSGPRKVAMARTAEQEARGYKQCARCKQDVVLSNFSKNMRAGDRLNRNCKPCEVARVKEYTDRKKKQR